MSALTCKKIHLISNQELIVYTVYLNVEWTCSLQDLFVSFFTHSFNLMQLKLFLPYNTCIDKGQILEMGNNSANRREFHHFAFYLQDCRFRNYWISILHLLDIPLPSHTPNTGDDLLQSGNLKDAWLSHSNLVPEKYKRRKNGIKNNFYRYWTIQKYNAWKLTISSSGICFNQKFLLNMQPAFFSTNISTDQRPYK